VEFQIFKDGKPVNDFQLFGAYLFGTDGIAIRRAQIFSKDGLIVCRKHKLQTAGLALLWPVEGFGKILLSTTCLPDKQARYNLNVELARARLMQIVNKREDWSFFNAVEDAENLADESRQLFIDALQNISNGPKASRLADESLKKATLFSEKLALKQAESVLPMRDKNRGFGLRCLGCRVDPALIKKPGYVDKLVESFGFVTIPTSWARIESLKGSYDFSTLDECINILSKKRLAICVGPLLCFSKEYLPRWLVEKSGSFERIRDSAYRFVLRLVSRYGGSVHAWRVVSGLNVYNHFGFNFHQVLEMVRAANMAVRAAGNRGVKIVEVCNPWGEYYATKPDTIPPLVYVDMAVQSGINFDAFGLQLRFGKNQPGMHVRDMMQISAILDYFGTVSKPLYITEVEIPGTSDSKSQDTNSAGYWYGEWDQARQGQWIEQFYKIALSKPFVDTVTYSHLVDVPHSILPQSGLFTAKLDPKPSFLVLQKLRGQIFNR